MNTEITLNNPIKLSRSELRRQKKKEEQKTATLNLTVGQLEKLVNEEVTKVLKEERIKMIKKIVHEYSVAVALVARDELKFGEVRMNRFLTSVMEMWDSIDREYVSIDDIEQALKEEIGLVIK